MGVPTELCFSHTQECTFTPEQYCDEGTCSDFEEILKMVESIEPGCYRNLLCCQAERCEDPLDEECSNQCLAESCMARSEGSACTCSSEADACALLRLGYPKISIK